MYDYMIVGSGIYGSVLAYELTKVGKSCLVIDRRCHIGGNCYTENVGGIEVHKYGPHIFNTNSDKIWEYVNSIYPINNYNHKVKVNYKGEIYSFPVNLKTFNQLWGCNNEEDVLNELKLRKKHFDKVDNLEKHVLNELGEEIYLKFYKGYSEKQWGTSCSNIPCSTGKRLPIRYHDNDHYHNSKYSGIPMNGSYTNIFSRLLDGIEVKLGEEFDLNWKSIAKNLIYSGSIDEYYNYCYGFLEYRSLNFKEYRHEISDYQGIAQVNYTDINIPYTRVIEHKHFVNNLNLKHTIITEEYPIEYRLGGERYYPVNSVRNQELYKKYYEKSKSDNVLFGGRLGSYKYLDMDAVFGMALKDFNQILAK